MKAPAEHRFYLSQHFNIRCTNIFNKEEMSILKQYGCWMEALENGDIKPITEEQEHFIQVARKETEPRTIYEYTWRKLKLRRQFDEKNMNITRYYNLEW